MATDAARLRAPARSRRTEEPTVAPRARPRPRNRRGVAGGVVWIVFVAALLGGLVALNVTVLQLNVRLDQLGRERFELRAQNATLASQLSRAASGPRIQALAQKRFGLVPAELDATVYLTLAPKQRRSLESENHAQKRRGGVGQG